MLGIARGGRRRSPGPRLERRRLSCRGGGATRRSCRQKATYSVGDERDLVLAGFMAFLDPPKESAAAQAIAALAGLWRRVVVLTGDNDVVTRRVCRDVGLPIDRVVLGGEIDALSDGSWRDGQSRRPSSRSSRRRRRRAIVRALQGRGHTVGFLGDGINDAPALRDADVGISVERRPTSPRESADIILSEKSLLVLEDGVLAGREVYGNIIKYIKMTASSNFGNMLQRADRERLPAVSADAAGADARAESAVRFLPDLDRRGTSDGRVRDEAAQVGRGRIARFMIYIGPISSVFDVTTFALLWFVMGASTVTRQGVFQIGLVHRVACCRRRSSCT